MPLKLCKPDAHENYHLEGNGSGPCLLSSKLDDRGQPQGRTRWYVYLGHEHGVVFVRAGEGGQSRIAKHDSPRDALEACNQALASQLGKGKQV